VVDPGCACADYDPRASRAASATGVDQRGSDHDSHADDYHERIDDLDRARDDADRGDSPVNVLTCGGTSRGDCSLQGRHLQLLADPLGNMLPSRRCRGLAHVVGRWRCW
jgi:hypothetical protein